MPITLTVPASVDPRCWSVRSLAVDMAIRWPKTVQRYVQRLSDDGHPCFAGYDGGPLTERQASVVREYRRLTTEVGLRGDPLWRAILDFPENKESRLTQLRSLLEAAGATAVEELIKSIEDIYK